MAKAKLWTPPFLCMGGINFFQFITQYILVTTLPLYVISAFSGNDVQAGLAMTSFQIGTSLFRPVAGYMIDKRNKRHLLLIALICFLIVITAFNFIFSIREIYVLRFIHGMLFSLATTTAAAIAVLVIPSARRGEGIGYFSVTTDLAMVIGPLAGLLLYNMLSPGALFLILTVLAVAMLIGALSIRLPANIIEPKVTRDTSPLAHLLEKKSLPASLLGGFVFFSYGGVLTFIPLYMHTLGLDNQTGVFFAVFALSIVVSRPFIGHMFDHYGAPCIVAPGFLFFIGGLILFSRVDTALMLYISGVILGLGFGALSPAFQTLAIQSVPPARAGAATATYFWFLDIFVGLAAATLGIVARAWGYTVMYGIVCPGIVVLAAIVYIVFHYEKAGV